MTTNSLRIRKSSIYVLGKFAEQSAGLLTTWLLMTQLSLSDYGIYNLFLAIAVYLGALSSIGIAPFYQFLRKYIPGAPPAGFCRVVQLGLGSRLILFLPAAAAVFWLLTLPEVELRLTGASNYFSIFVITAISLLQAGSLQRILETLFLHKYVALANLVYTLCRLFALGIIFYLGYGLWEVLWMDLAASLVLLSAYARYAAAALNSLPDKPGAAAGVSFAALLKQLLKTGRLNFFDQPGTLLFNISTDFVIIAFFLDLNALGRYAFVAHLSYLISKCLPGNLLKGVIIPAYFSRYACSNNKIELGKMFRIISKLTAFILFPIFIITVILGREIVGQAFDARYLDAYPAMVLLLFYHVMLSFPASLPLQVLERTEFRLIGKIALVYNIVMSAVLVQHWGITGVALASASAILWQRMVEYYMAKKHVQASLPWKDLLKILFNSLTVGALALLAKPLLGSLPALGIFLAAAAIIYLALSYFNMAFISEERRLLYQLAGKPYSRFPVKG